jgi:hypothetical protein
MAKPNDVPATGVGPRMTSQEEYMLGDLIFRRNPYTSSGSPMVPTGANGQWEWEPWPLVETKAVQWWPFAGRSLSVGAALLVKYRYQRPDGSTANEELIVGYERELQDLEYPQPTPAIAPIGRRPTDSRAAGSTHQHRRALGEDVCAANPFPHAQGKPMKMKPGWQSVVELDPSIQRWWTPFSPAASWRRVRQTVRVPYFWEIPDPNDNTRMIEVWEHVLFGYVGAGGGF